MGALRWILLLAGLVFLAALAAWESRRPRQARRDAPGRSERSEPEMGTMGAASGTAAAASAARMGSPGSSIAEEPPAAGGHIYTGASLGGSSSSAGGSGGGRTRAEPPPRIDLPPLDPDEPGAAPGEFGRRIAGSTIVVDEPISAHGPGPAAGQGDAEPYYVYARAEPGGGASASGHSLRADYPLPGEHALPGEQALTGERSLPGDLSLPGELPRSPVVDWPPESERHILSLRIAALGHERLSGRVVRLALCACGFEHGRFGIFHQPGADGRALLSAANLSKPGIFDLPNMDFQRFSGLSLFAVLPGPLPPAAALDHLLDTAQDLAERLRARLQDEQGLTLGATQLESLRRTVQDLTAAEPAEPAA
jgi:FtsZ-interacting cell division protein ZipA